MNYPHIKNINKSILSDNWYLLNKYTYDFRLNNGNWIEQQRECYDRGNGAVILLFNKQKNTVVLTKQFRMPTFVNGNSDGYMIEACAGLLDNDNPEDCIKKEAEEETGYKIENVTRIMKSYSSPGSVTEILYFFVAEYSDDMKVNEGGGVVSETEDIEVLEMSFNAAIRMVEAGQIYDMKTIILLQYAQIHKLLN